MRWRSFLFPKPKALVLRLAIFGSLLPILGWCGGSYWIFDLFNHFQWQYLCLLGVAFVTLLCMREWRFAALASLCLAIPLTRIGLGVADSPYQPFPGGKPLRITSFNVLTANTRYGDALSWIHKTMPDVIFLPEVDEEWAAQLRPLQGSHPYVVEHIVEGNFGFACYSKLPILEQEIIPCGELELPLLKLRLQGEGKTFVFFGAHPVPPGNEFWARERDVFLGIIAAQVEAQKDTVIVAGDMNATVWSQGMKPLKDAGLRGWEGIPTWSRENPLLAVPIDHVLYRKDESSFIESSRYEVGPDLGSDHRPVTRDLVW